MEAGPAAMLLAVDLRMLFLWDIAAWLAVVYAFLLLS